MDEVIGAPIPDVSVTVKIPGKLANEIRMRWLGRYGFDVDDMPWDERELRSAMQHFILDCISEKVQGTKWHGSVLHG